MSEIVGHDVQIGLKVGSRLDPLQIEREAAVAYEHEDPDQRWTLDKAEAAVEKGKPKVAGADGKPSEINHGNIAPSIDDSAGGVTVSKAVQTTVISLAALRRLRFANQSRDAETAARTAVAALGVAALALQYEMDHDLRSRCLLIPQHPPRIELVGRDGSAPETVDITRDRASQILGQAAQASSDLGLAWQTAEIRLQPAPKLFELLRRSREVSARETPEE